LATGVKSFESGGKRRSKFGTARRRCFAAMAWHSLR